MAMTEEARHALYEAFKESIGVDNANTIMAALPPVGWADVATKRDLDVVEHSVEGKLELLEARVDMKLEGLRADVLARLGDLQRNLFLALFTAQATTIAVLVAVAR